MSPHSKSFPYFLFRSVLASVPALFVIGMIWYLTRQTPTQTVDLSGNFGHLVSRVLNKLVRVCDLPAWTIHASDQNIVVLKHWTLPFRKIAHTLEFAAVAFTTVPCVSAWTSMIRAMGRPSWFAYMLSALSSHLGRVETTLALSLAWSMICSLTDQTHKLFVPGRHWDTGDLWFDLAGYGGVIGLFWLTAGLFGKLRQTTPNYSQDAVSGFDHRWESPQQCAPSATPMSHQG